MLFLRTYNKDQPSLLTPLSFATIHEECALECAPLVEMTETKSELALWLYQKCVHYVPGTW